MQVRVVQEREDLLVLRLSHTHVDLVNGLRRSILNHVPTAAISTVHVLSNHSVMADEFLSHRLGLVPLVCPADPETDVAKEPFVLEARGPCLVTSGRLRHPSLRVVDPHVPLVLLGDKQEIRLRAFARWGTGQEHARFSPAAPVFYRFVPRVEVADIEDWGALQRACPRRVFQDDGTVDAAQCTFCGECTRTGMDERAARVRVVPQEGEFELTVEGTGALAPRAAVAAAVRALRQRLGALDAAVGRLGAAAGKDGARAGVSGQTCSAPARA